LTFQLSVL